MPDHVSIQVRDALVTQVTGLSTTGSRVYPARVFPLEPGNMPGIVVKLGELESEVVSMGGPNATVAHDQLVTFDIYVRTSSDVDSALLQVAKEINAAILDDFSLGGLAKWIFPTGNEAPEYDADADQKHARMSVNYTVRFHTTASAVDVAT